MQAIYHTSLDEIDFSFFEMLKKQFKKAKVDIVIKEDDETDYLNSSKENKKRLESAIERVKKEEFITLSQDELQK